MTEIHPSTWHEVAHLVNDYLGLPCGRVVYEEATTMAYTEVPPTIVESLYELMHLRWPMMRRVLRPDQKFAVIRVLDEDGKPLVHATFEPASLCTFDRRKIKSLACKLKRCVEAK